jgi:undecaprenyl pyrophosphate phosphatase UppP
MRRVVRREYRVGYFIVLALWLVLAATTFALFISNPFANGFTVMIILIIGGGLLTALQAYLQSRGRYVVYVVEEEPGGGTS